MLVATDSSLNWWKQLLLVANGPLNVTIIIVTMKHRFCNTAVEKWDIKVVDHLEPWLKLFSGGILAPSHTVPRLIVYHSRYPSDNILKCFLWRLVYPLFAAAAQSTIILSTRRFLRERPQILPKGSTSLWFLDPILCSAVWHCKQAFNACETAKTTAIVCVTPSGTCDRGLYLDRKTQMCFRCPRGWYAILDDNDCLPCPLVERLKSVSGDSLVDCYYNSVCDNCK